ncbi:MAG: CvpA family protein [Candidatus Hydrothermia bacterium]|jgi:membrane protein required for colicin V production|nr:CvpA family protein [Candidatus Hydrothermia bacterium]
MSGIDIIILVIIAFGLINGLRSGFISELIALISLIIGILFGLKFYGILMPYLGNNETLSILGMFIISYFLSQFILNLILKPFRMITGKTAINSILGGIFGAIEMTLFLSIIAYGIRWNDFYAQLSQKSQILKIIEKSTFPIFDSLFKK